MTITAYCRAATYAMPLPGSLDAAAAAIFSMLMLLRAATPAMLRYEMLALLRHFASRALTPYIATILYAHTPALFIFTPFVFID